MRRGWMLVLVGTLGLPACRGSERGAIPDSARAMNGRPGAPTPGQPGAPAESPIIGTVHEVKMLADGRGYRYEPAEITVKPGDGIRFVNVSGGPHNVAFDPATVPSDAKDQLWANMRNSYDGSGPVLTAPNETWTLSLGGVKPGSYQYHCVPHLAMGMKGVITVEP